MNNTNTFYLDMDGVIADWEAGAALVLGSPVKTLYVENYHRHTREEWAILRQAHRMYRDLPLMPRAGELVDLARGYRDQLGWQLLFLTAVPANDDVPWAFYDKVLWATERFPDIPVHFGPHSTEKHRHCSPGDILVDDRLDNCTSWRAAGGLAVHVVGHTIDHAIEQVRADFLSRSK